MATVVATQAVARLAARDATRTEADIQADVYLLLTAGGLHLDASQVARLEVGTGDGTRRRIDVEIGHAVIELKRDLRIPGVMADAEKQLAGYVAAQSEKLGTRYVGILTDGTDWYLYRLEHGDLVPVSDVGLNPSTPDADRLLVWIEAILAIRVAVFPTPKQVERRLGSESPAHKLDHSTLRSLYDEAADHPEVALKRGLWAKLLRTAFGKAFSDDPRLFIDHTLLVLTAEIIAHAVIGFDVSRAGSLTPTALASGTEFSNAQIHGVVEADFFDWVLHVPGGPRFVADLADRIAQFDWSQVDHDVLKLLYESVISQEDRASLGEYYTPDWLAERMVAEEITEPLAQRVLDPSCGSGTFIFHAVRAFLVAADLAGIPNGNAIDSLTNHVFGMDVHPVAVTLARVTYLLAIGAQRLVNEDRGPMTVPVYLGDSLQWEQRRDLLGGQDEVTITTTGDDLVEGGGGALFGDDLVFPSAVLQDAATFDQLVTAMADRAVVPSSRPSGEIVKPILKHFGIHDSDVPTLVQTFDTMRRLHDSGRDHIWGYYVRNLIRPLWFEEAGHKVDRLIGNPPWLRYSKMLNTMQARYKKLAKERGLLSGPLGASGRDLSTLFVARAVELYLKVDGRFAFLMPHGTLTRKPHDGFRAGKWSSDAGGQLTVAFDHVWDLANAPTGFPMVSCAVFGTRTNNDAKRMPTDVEIWAAKLPSPNVTWEVIENKLTRVPGRVIALGPDDSLPESPYRTRFRNGAILYPRLLLFAVEAPAGPLGPGKGRVAVTSRRTTTEKKPWKSAASISATVERTFFKPVHMGETLLPFRMSAPLTAVLPVGTSAMLAREEIEQHAGLADWWTKAEATWTDLRVEDEKAPLRERIDYHGQLSAQLPTPTHRVAYTASGNTLAAARIDDPKALIEHKLYWAAVSGVDEARYLVGILNSQTVLDRVTPLQTLGLFGARDFDKTVFHVPIPTFDGGSPSHRALVDLVAQAEQVAAAVDVSTAADFKGARKLIRQALAGLLPELEAAVEVVVPTVDVD